MSASSGSSRASREALPMKVVLSWLRERCPTELPPEELAETLSVRGAHVEAVIRPWQGLEGVIVARVLEVLDHPNSEKLCVARVHTGSGEHEVVVGVRNMAPGDLAPLAGPGARVPGLTEPLTARTIRGVVSNGMLCSPQELAISGEHLGILILPADAPLGADVKTYLGLDDAVLDVEIEPNRPDLMSVLGVAREVAAATGVPVAGPDLSVTEGGEPATGAATVRVLDAERCPRYVARVISGVRVGPSPIRVQARLTAAGMRPVSNVVDATNYAMLELGQPLHAFDLDLLAGRSIIVRRAEADERLVTLDDVERTLTTDDLVIADGDRSVGIAGVMGSASVEVHPGTVDVLLESAHFQRKGVIRTSRRLGLNTEASARFGRGADPEAPPLGAAMGARLIAEWAGGSVMAGSIDVGAAPPRRTVAVRPGRATSLLGYPVTGAAIVEAFGTLGLRAEARADEVAIEIPGYRVDLEREVDLIEEVVRVQGYWNVGSTVPGIREPGGVAPSFALRRRVRHALVRAGMREAISLSFASARDLELTGDGGGVRVANPVSAEEGLLRAGLVPGLLHAARRNVDRGVGSVALFEVEHVFRAGDAVDERVFVAGLFLGPAGTGVHEDRRDLDFYDAKGAVAAMMEGLVVQDWGLGSPAGSPFHPARSARVLAGGEDVGVVGELHPGEAERRALPGRVALFEVDLSSLAAR